MRKKLIIAVIALVVVVILLFTVFSGYFGQNLLTFNKKPVVTITYPFDKATVSHLVMISGTASDPDKTDVVSIVEVQIGDGDWVSADGTNLWSYDWTTYGYSNGQYVVSARSYDGKDYSNIKSITLTVDNPQNVDSNSHKWAIFIAAANFPAKNESKLRNGGLYLAEDMAAYFIENYNYATSNVWILFDDGWIRKDEGYGARLETLQERSHKYDITYGGATMNNVVMTFDYLINESNKYDDSEVFIWIFDHGFGDTSNTRNGGKLFQSSQIFLWDNLMSDKELGKILSPLKSKKTSLIVDACYSGGFADKTILNLPTSLLFKSGIPKNGRVVISGSSKFRPGYASTTDGPLFSYLWFQGLTTGDADGFKAGFLHRGIQRHLKFFKDGKVSVEEAFYYARYILRTDAQYTEYKNTQPQINDRYPRGGLLLSHKELFL